MGRGQVSLVNGYTTIRLYGFLLLLQTPLGA